MFAKISRGGRMGGLMVYLAGPGRANEHEHPHVVAGSPGVEAWYAGGELDRDGALRLAKYLDRPARVHDTKVVQGVYAHAATGARDADGQRVMERQAVRDQAGRHVMADAHVYHVPLSLRAAEGRVDDAEWRAIAHEFMDRMGLAPKAAGADADDDQEPVATAPVRWAAVHHGASKDGNDHIHLVVNLVREDGSKIDVHRDFTRAKQVCRELEEEFGLMPLHPNEYELARTYARANYERDRATELVTPGADPRIPWLELSDEQQQGLIKAECGSEREWERALRNRNRRPEPGTAEKFDSHHGAKEAVGRAKARANYDKRLNEGTASTPWAQLPAGVRDDLVRTATPAEDPSTTLARIVRGCAASSRDEAEFVRRLRGFGADPVTGRGGALLVRPRFTQGRSDVVEGYSVALRPANRDERPIWRGGYRFGKDLSLPRLRGQWQQATADDPSAGVAAADAAVAEWTAAKTGQRPAAPGREEWMPTPGQAEEKVRGLVRRIGSIAPDDRETLARVHREAAGAFAAWSARAEGLEPGPLARAADALARGAETTTGAEPGKRRVPLPSLAGTAYLLSAAAGTGPAAELAVIKALMDLTTSLVQLHAANREALRAARVEDVLRSQLASVVTRLEGEQRQLVDVGAATTTATEQRVDQAVGGEGVDRGQRSRQAAFPDRPTPGKKPTAADLQRPRRGPEQSPGRETGPER